MFNLTFMADYINVLVKDSAFEVTARAYISGIKETSFFKAKNKQLFIPTARLIFPDGTICSIRHEDDQRIVHIIDATSNSFEEARPVSFKLENEKNHALTSGTRLEFQLRISSPSITSNIFCFELAGDEWRAID